MKGKQELKTVKPFCCVLSLGIYGERREKRERERGEGGGGTGEQSNIHELLSRLRELFFFGSKWNICSKLCGMS
jgi:hypothetical protein